MNIITETDRYLFGNGLHYEIYEKMGAHVMEIDGVKGTYFAVWAPNAVSVNVICIAVLSLGEYYTVVHVVRFYNFSLVSYRVELVLYDILLSFVQSQSLHSAQ